MLTFFTCLEVAQVEYIVMENGRKENQQDEIDRWVVSRFVTLSLTIEKHLDLVCACPSPYKGLGKGCISTPTAETRARTIPLLLS